MNDNDATPDLAGTWEMHGTALSPDGAALYEFDSELTLTAMDGAFSAATETKGAKSSRSVSFAEKLTGLSSGEWHFRYGYEADPGHFATASHSFFGLSQLTFSADLQRAQGTSCNYNGRYMVARLEARRKESPC